MHHGPFLFRRWPSLCPLLHGKGHNLRLHTRANWILGCQMSYVLSPFGFPKGESLRSPRISCLDSSPFCGLLYGTFMRSKNNPPKYEPTVVEATRAPRTQCPLPRECQGGGGGFGTQSPQPEIFSKFCRKSKARQVADVKQHFVILEQKIVLHNLGSV